MLACDFLQQDSQVVAFLTAKGGKKSLLVLAGDLAQLFQYRYAVFRKLQRIQTAVFGVGHSLYETSLLQVVQYGHQPARMDLQSGR